MAERRALLLVPVDPLLHRVDVDERQHVLAGQQRGAAGQLGQQQPVHLPQLEHVPPGERRAGTSPAWTAPGPRRTAPASPRAAAGPGHRCCPPRAIIPATRQGTFRCGVHPAPVGDGHVLTGQRGQARPLGQRHHRHQARPRHQIRVIKRRVDLRQLMQQSHLTGAPSDQVMEASATPIVPGQGAPFASTRRTRPLFTRWIEAKSAQLRTGRCSAADAREQAGPGDGSAQAGSDAPAAHHCRQLGSESVRDGQPAGHARFRGAHARRANACLARNPQPAGRLTGSVVVHVSPLHSLGMPIRRFAPARTLTLRDRGSTLVTRAQSPLCARAPVRQRVVVPHRTR